MNLLKNNLFTHIAADIPQEIFETIIQTPQLRVERILSKGQQSPDNFWYDQEETEWVLLLAGNAKIEFEHGIIELKAGDYLNIAARQKHRVAYTTPDEVTIWLAIFYKT